MKYLFAVIFISAGIALLISPAFVPETAVYNISGIFFIAMGMKLLKK